MQSADAPDGLTDAFSAERAAWLAMRGRMPGQPGFQLDNWLRWMALVRQADLATVRTAERLIRHPIHSTSVRTQFFALRE